MAEVVFQPGDVVVLTGESWPPVQCEHGDATPAVGTVVVIEESIWPSFRDGGLGMFHFRGGGFEWCVWPDRDHVFGGTLIHRPSLGQAVAS